MEEPAKRGPLSEQDLEKLAFFNNQIREAEQNIKDIQARCEHRMSGIRGGGIQILNCEYCNWSEGPTYD